MAARYFFNFGPQRGRCRHNHRTLLGLIRCLRREKQGTDRRPWVHDNTGEIFPLDDIAEYANPFYVLLLGGH